MTQTTLIAAIIATPSFVGQTDAQVAAAFNANLCTVIPMPLVALRQYLNTSSLQSRISRTPASATFATVCAGQSPPLNLVLTQDGVNDAITYITTIGSSETLDTTEPAIAVKNYALLQLMVAANSLDVTMGMTSAEVAGFLAVGGGLQFGPGSVQTSDVTTARATIAAQAASAAAAATRATGMNAVRAQWNTYAAAGNAILAQADADATQPIPTLAQLVAAGAAVES